VLSINPLSYAFHENLGIDDNKASELYHANPNDPAIVQWKSALQSAINSLDKCVDIRDPMTCDKSLITTIISNCKSHPNTLLACNDSRLPQWAQKIAEEEQKYVEEMRKQKQAIIDKCIIDSLNASSKFDVASPSCADELLFLAKDCVTNSSSHEYCKDERFIGYLTQNNIILNSTVSPYSNLTGNSSSSNSTYP
jgi:hypothetical protein